MKIFIVIIICCRVNKFKENVMAKTHGTQVTGTELKQNCSLKT